MGNPAKKMDLQWFGRENGFVSPLLSNLASDYSRSARQGLIAPVIFPRVTVGKPSGKYAVFDAEAAFKVPDVLMAGERSRAHEFAASGKMKDYATSRYGLKSFIDKADLEFMDGPFKLWERRKTEPLVGKLELAQEKRIADTIFALPGRSTALAGAGTGKANKWSAASTTTGGDLNDLYAAYGEDRIAGWSRLNPDTAGRAITDAAAEIDGYLLSGGYTVPLPGTPANIKKYCIDIASANLVLSAGVLDGDPGGKAVLEQAKIARQYLTKVAEGKFVIPGYGGDTAVSKPPSGNVQTRTSSKLDWRGY